MLELSKMYSKHNSIDNDCKNRGYMLNYDRT